MSPPITLRLHPQQEETAGSSSVPAHHNQFYPHIIHSNTSTSEIEEENSTDDLFEINHESDWVQFKPIKEDELEGISMFSFDIHSRGEEDCVYVAVGKSESSMDAVSWTLNNLVNNHDSTIIYLIHVFPEIRHIPSPLGKLPKNQVSHEQVQIYMAQERSKRRQLLQKFINLCSASKVKVDTMLIESDNVAKAILGLIPILNIRKLVLGTTKSGLRKLRSRKGGGRIADQILDNASEICDIKIICDGKEVIQQMMNIRSPPPLPRADDSNAKNMELREQSNHNQVFSCMCFKSPRVM